MTDHDHDLIVVGGGNAGLCAALAARETGARVVVLERAPKEWRGGNSAFTGGLFRAPYTGLDELRRIMPDLSDAEVKNVEFGSYPEDAFFEDLARVSDYRADPDLTETVVRRGQDTLVWMREHGIRFLPPFGRRSVKEGERTIFQSGAVIEASGGGAGLVEMLYVAAERAGIEIRYETRGRSLLTGASGVTGVVTQDPRGTHELRARGVVLAAGGFSSNPAWRAAYLGAGWDLARARGTRFNTGDGLTMAQEVGAGLAGNWSGCHATPWELNAPEFGDPRAARTFFRAHYNFGIMVNRDGDRFVDEGADFKNYTYAKYGRSILEQPGQVAWQVFDAQTYDLLGKEEYRSGNSTRVTADSIEELAGKLEGVDSERFVATVQAYNDAVDRQAPFNPSILDGKGTVGLRVPKSNWATPLEDGPFEAFAVTCGLTFTFGGLRVGTDAAVLDAGGAAIPGLYAAGEIVGGLFYSNYAAGTGLTTGAVMGQLAGRHALGAAA